MTVSLDENDILAGVTESNVATHDVLILCGDHSRIVNDVPLRYGVEGVVDVSCGIMALPMSTPRLPK